MMENNQKSFDAIAIGTSAGGLEALSIILSGLPKNFAIPILVVIHLPPNIESRISNILDDKCALTVVESFDKMNIEKGYVYFAPPSYHMMIENTETIALAVDEAVQYSRPSIDVLFETAAEAYKDKLLGIILTGANSDGAKGLNKIVSLGGQAIVQEPNEAEMNVMPKEALRVCPNAKVKSLMEIKNYLMTL